MLVRPRTAQDGGARARRLTIRGYQDLEQIGDGPAGPVFRARQERPDRMVALKLLNLKLQGRLVRHQLPHAVELTDRMAANRQVVTVFDSGLSETGQPYVAMEYFEGGSLFDRLSASGPLSAEETVRIVLALCEALGDAHRNDILHRAIKPQNILMSVGDQPVLSDFRPAGMTVPLEVGVGGTAAALLHMAPETLQGSEPTPSADVYSLASTLFHVLAGRPPYRPDGGGLAALLLRMLSEDPPRIQRTDVPAAFSDVLRQAMARDPSERFPDASVFGEALQRLRPEPVPAAAVPAVPRPASGPAAGHPAAAEAVPWPSPVDPDDPDDAVDPDDAPAERGHAPSPETGAPTHEIGEAVGAPRRRARVTAIVVTGLVVLSGSLVLAARQAADPGHSPVLTTTAAAPTGTRVAGAPSSGAAPDNVPSPGSAPDNVTTVDNGNSVSLHWVLASGSESGYVLVQQAPNDPGRPVFQPLPPGTTSYTATGLNPSAGYCFVVGVLLRLGSAGQPGTVAWSAPACVRGAVASIRGS